MRGRHGRCLEPISISLALALLVLVGCTGQSDDRGDSGDGLVDVWALAIDPARPTTVYAAASGALFRSRDGGRHWARMSLERGVGAVVIDPGTRATVYAAGGGISKSIDGGTSWQAINTGLCTGECPAIEVLAIDPVRPGTLYAGAWFEGVYKTTNGGCELASGQQRPHGS